MQLFVISEREGNDLEKLNLIDDVLEDGIYKIQQGISLAMLGVPHVIAFSDCTSDIMNKVLPMLAEIENDLIKQVANAKVLQYLDSFESTLEQLKEF